MSGQTAIESKAPGGNRIRDLRVDPVGDLGFNRGQAPGGDPGRRAATGRHRAETGSKGRSLDERFDPRRNHLSSIRLVLAVTVVVVHGQAVGFGHQPHLGTTGLGELAVDTFFVLSGFLLAGSYVRLGSIRRYTWHRFLRIMPGFWICLLLIAFVVAPAVAVLQGQPASSVFDGEKSAFHFLTSNATLLMREYGVAGLPVGVPEPGVLNGSLWTLFYEALCYAGVVGLGVIGALKRRPWISLAVVVLLWATLAVQSAGIYVVGHETPLRFALMFLLGTVLWIYADRVPIHGTIAAVALALLIGSLLLMPDYRVLGGPALAYLSLWLAVIRPPRWVPKSDFSYGLYIYHWPILQVLVVSGVHDRGETVFVVTGILLALAAAFFSWDFVEAPALRLKNAAWVTWGRTRRSAALQQ